MNKIKRITLALLIMIIAAFTSFTASAAELEKVTFADSKITVSGNCSTSNQVQVIIFDADSKPIYFSTVDVNNNSFNKTLDAAFNLEEGKTYTVKIADYDGKNVSRDTFTVEAGNPGHTHTYETEWKSDQTSHWHECICGEKSDTAAHTFGNWVVTKSATSSENGSKERICSICGYKETAVIEATVSAHNSTDASPKTGNSMNILLWITLLSVSGVLTIFRIKHKTIRKSNR